MTGRAQTVLGPVLPEELGLTTTHEHLFIEFTCMFTMSSGASERHKAAQPLSLENLAWVRYDPFRNLDNLLLTDEEATIAEAALFKKAGGGTIVDATTIGIGRDPLALARVARATGLNIVMGAGFYIGAVHPEDMDSRTEDDLTRQIVHEVTAGVGDTGVKAGIIGELGCSWPLTYNEHKVLRAAAAAQRQTGAAILIHPGRNEAAPFEILDVLAGAGADLHRVIMGHLDRTFFNANPLLDLAKRGTYLEYDLFGWEVSNYPLSERDMISDAQRIGWIELLIGAGHAEQVVVAQDIYSKHRTTKYGGHGYHHVLENIIPRMRQRGIREQDIQTIYVDNPARVLTFA